MADAVELQQIAGAGPEKKASVPAVPLIMAVVAAIVVAVAGIGGAGFWLVRSGRLPLGKGPALVQAATRPDSPKTRLIALDPLLVNLADEGGASYLRVGMTLKVEDSPPAKGEKPKEERADKGKPVNENEAAMRDAALGVLGRETGQALLAPGGKERLKTELRQAMAVRVPEVKVMDVLFTDFLVQR